MLTSSKFIVILCTRSYLIQSYGPSDSLCASYFNNRSGTTTTMRNFKFNKTVNGDSNWQFFIADSGVTTSYFASASLIVEVP